MKFEEIRKHSIHALADIQPCEEIHEHIEWEGHSLSRDEFPVSELIFFALTRFRDMTPFGPQEKLRWGFKAVFRNIPFELSLQKFGLYLYMPEGTKSEMRSALAKCLKVASRLAEKCLQDEAQYQIQNANVSIENQYHHFRGAYRFFRDIAEQTYNKPPDDPVVMRKDGNEQPTGWTFSPWKHQIEGGYLAGAMLDAYFSWLEHALVLVLAFIDFNPTGGQLLRFVGNTWGEKWRTIFDITTDYEAKQIYDLLKRIKETVRNPNSHGGFRKKGTSFYFHVDRIGAALPVLLTKQKRSLEFTITPVPNQSYTELCGQLDCCDKFLQNSKIQAGLQYLRAGLNVSFSEDFRRQCRQASESEKALKEFIEQQADLMTMHANMDY